MVECKGRHQQLVLRKNMMTCTLMLYSERELPHQTHISFFPPTREEAGVEEFKFQDFILLTRRQHAWLASFEESRQNKNVDRMSALHPELVLKGLKL
jgi:hypothetical protein